MVLNRVYIFFRTPYFYIVSAVHFSVVFVLVLFDIGYVFVRKALVLTVDGIYDLADKTRKRLMLQCTLLGILLFSNGGELFRLRFGSDG